MGTSPDLRRRSSLGHPLANAINARMLQHSATKSEFGVFEEDEFLYKPEVVPGPFREASRILLSDYLNGLLACLIVFSMAVLVVEADCKTSGEDMPQWAVASEWALGIVYVMEILARLVVFRWRFFRYLYNIVDLVVIICDAALWIMALLVDTSTESLSWIQIIRLLRVGRLLRLMFFFPVLRLMLKSLAGAFRVMFFGMVLVLVVVFVWAVFGVYFIHPRNAAVAEAGVYDSRCARCPGAFSSVFDAVVTLTKDLVAQDGWGEIAMPVIEAYPETYIYFFLAYSTVTIAILNLILAVIVDTALEARKDDIHAVARVKREQRSANAKRLQELFSELDVDGNGVLTHAELEKAFETHEEFMDIMTAMDICAHDLDTIFLIMDENGTGDIDHKEFVNELHKMQAGDSHTMLVFIRCMVSQIRNMLMTQMKESEGVCQASSALS